MGGNGEERVIRRTIMIAAAVVAFAAPGLGTPAFSQETAEECASALWLEPLAAEAESEETELRTIEEAPTWLTAELTDACTGETFTLAGFAGKTVYVEPMATWCTTCRAQLGRVQEAAAQLTEEQREDVVLIALSSEVGLPNEAMAQYAKDTGFPMIFAVMTAEVLRAMVEELGQEIAVPPATPHFIIGPNGTVGDVATGDASPEELLALFTAAEDASAP
jgi:thiol-disulfide isomerase/thioredoxin